MYGLEKGKKEGAFLFDLEIEIKEHPKKGKELLEKAERRMLEVKNLLREGTSEKGGLDKLGVLLKGYTALQKVLQRAVK